MVALLIIEITEDIAVPTVCVVKEYDITVRFGLFVDKVVYQADFIIERSFAPAVLADTL